MSKLPADVPRREVIKVLGVFGFQFEREGARHTVFSRVQNSVYTRVEVPRHPTVNKRLLDMILDEAGITREQYLANR